MKLSGYLRGMGALAAVLRKLETPTSRDNVERAVVVALEYTVADIPWAEVVRRATIEQVLSVSADGLWSAGPDVNDVPSLT